MLNSRKGKTINLNTQNAFNLYNKYYININNIRNNNNNNNNSSSKKSNNNFKSPL